MRRIKPLIVGALLCLGLQGYGQTPVALWTSVKFQATLTPRWEILADQGLRIYSDAPELRRYSSSLQISYKICESLKTGASVALIRQHKINDAWETRSRYFVYALGNHNVGRINLSLYERLQQIVYTDGKPSKELLRSRLTAALPIKGGAYRPRIALETRYVFNTHILDEWRMTAGNRFRLNSRNVVDTFVHGIARSYPIVGWRWTIVMGVDYIYSF